MGRWSALAGRASAVIALIWIGVLVGVDLVAAPAPFRAEGLERVHAVAVNRELFGAASRVELVLLALVAAGTLAGRTGRLRAALLVALAAVVALQALWLLPALAARTELILAGADPGPGPVHGLYVGLEGAKLLLLAALGLSAFAAPRKKSPGDGTG